MTGLEQEIAAHPSVVMWLLTALCSAVLILSGVLVRAICGRLAALDSRMKAGDREFSQLRRAVVSMALILVPICSEIMAQHGKEADCDELYKLIKEAAD